MVAQADDEPQVRRSLGAIKATLKDPRATHYEVLGVCPGAAGPSALTNARRSLAFMFHPDLNDNNEVKADYMARINVAHGVLEDAKKRKLYDAQLASSHKKCPPCAGEGFKWKTVGFTGKKFIVCLGCGGAGWVRK